VIASFIPGIKENLFLNIGRITIQYRPSPLRKCWQISVAHEVWVGSPATAYNGRTSPITGSQITLIQQADLQAWRKAHFPIFNHAPHVGDRPQLIRHTSGHRREGAGDVWLSCL
jgi:hypothetical protein